MASSSYLFFVLLVVGLMQSPSVVSGQPWIADTIGSECYPPSPSFPSPCSIPDSVCTPTNDAFGTWQCACRPGMEPSADFTKCIYDATFPLNATECKVDLDCTGPFPGTVCRVNRIMPNAVSSNPRPVASSTGKRCQCADDKTVDPKASPGCTEPLTGTTPGVIGCQSRGGNGFCKERNPDYACIYNGPDKGKCTCTPPAVVNAAGACTNPNLVVCTTDLDCTLVKWDAGPPLTTDKATAKCDTKLKRCICYMNKQNADTTLNLQEIPAGTPGSPVFIVNSSPAGYKCAANRGQSICSSDANCATQFGHMCWKVSPNNATAPGQCMCPPLKRFSSGGLTCNDAYGRCCNINPASPANSYQCGLPITPTPGVSNLSCMQNSQTCGCPVGFYNTGIGCTSTPPVGGQSVCDARSSTY